MKNLYTFIRSSFILFVILGLSVNAQNSIMVTNTNDAGAGSFRDAIGNAIDGDTIKVSSGIAGDTLHLTSGRLTINRNVIIIGNGFTIDADSLSRIFYLNGLDYVSVSGITFIDGGQEASGLGLYANNVDSLFIDNCHFKNNIASGTNTYGGAMYARTTNAIITNSTFEENKGIATSKANAGGIYHNKGLLSLSNCSLLNNSISGAGNSYGGGIYVLHSKLTLKDNLIVGNTINTSVSVGNGGAVYIDVYFNETDAPSNPILIQGNIIESNLVSSLGSTSSGGGIFLDLSGYGTATIKGNILIGNQTSLTPANSFGSTAGGGLYIKASDFVSVIVSENRVNGNHALVNSAFSAIRAEGGGIYVTTLKCARIELKKNTVDENKSEAKNASIAYGGGLYLTKVITSFAYSDSTTTSITVENNTIANNICTSEDNAFGGGAYAYFSNSHTNPIHLSGNIDFIENTISANTVNSISGGRGGGLQANLISNSGAITSGIKVKGNIIAENTATTGKDCYGDGDDLTSLGYNLIGDNRDATAVFASGTPNGNNDIVGTSGSPIDPLLGILNPNGGEQPTMALLQNSPAIDAGDPSNNKDDQRGYEVIGVQDIGAFEYGSIRHGEISVKGNGVNIMNQDDSPSLIDGTDFGTTCLEVLTQDYWIYNSGTDSLLLNLPVTINGSDTMDFQITQMPSEWIAQGDSSLLRITFYPLKEGLREAFISISSDDANEPQWDFLIHANYEKDVVAPLAIAKDTTFYISDTSGFSITAAELDLGSSDNCLLESIGIDQSTFDCSDIGTNQVIFTATDAEGITDTVHVNVQIKDTLVNEVRARDTTLYFNGVDLILLDASLLDDGSSDLCGIANFGLSRELFSCDDVGINNLIFTATDVNGNSDTVHVKVTVVDNELDEIRGRDTTLYLDENGFASLDSNSLDDGSNDLCGIEKMTLSQYGFHCWHKGEQQVAFTVYDFNGNWKVQLLTVTVVDTTFSLNGSVTVKDASCYNGNDGYISVRAVGGTSPYSFSYNNSAFIKNDSVKNDLVPGTYSVQVLDSNLCDIHLGTFTIGHPDSIQINTELLTPITCYGDSSASFVVRASGGTGNYSYQLVGVGVQTDSVFDNLPAGTYTLYVDDDNSCTASTSITIDQKDSIYSWFDVINPICFGDRTGSITVHASNSNKPFNFSMDGIVYQLDSVFSDLHVGIYTIYIRDANGCQVQKSVEIVEPQALDIITQLLTPITCYGDSSASFVVRASGGTGNYSYQLVGVGVQTDSVFDNLPSGIYTLNVDDDNSCTASTSITIDQKDSIYSWFDVVNPSCFGDSTGSITVHASNGNKPYEFSLDGVAYQYDSVFIDLPADIYTIYIRDANGCLVLKSVEIEEPDVLEINTVVEPEYYNNQNGSIAITATGGVAPYVYGIWDLSGDSLIIDSSTISGLSLGYYLVGAIDANGCLDTATVFVDRAIGIEELNTFDVLIYPNPSTGLVTIDLTGFDAKRIQVLNLLGEVMQQSSNLKSNRPKLDLSAYPRGSYFIKIEGDSESIVKTVILQ